MRIENAITIERAATLFPAVDGRRPSTATVRTWMRDGARGVRLEGIAVGSRLVTTPEAIERFMLATSRAAGLAPELEEVTA